MRIASMACITALALAATAGCKKHVQTPADFAEMKDPGYGYEYRAISSDEIVIGVQKRANEPEGDVEFWSKVWQEKYPPIKDYLLVTTEDIKTRGGLEGSVLEFTSEEEDGLYRLLVALFVVKKKIWIVSAGGRDAAVTDKRDAIIDAFETFKP